ncbi:hypothetical protein [Sphingomonas koreensis]
MRLLAAAIAATAIAALPAAAQERQKSIEPYIDLAQVLVADFDSDEVLTYTSVGVGVDASIQTRRVEVQLSYKYEHRFSYSRDVADGDTHSGLARAAVKLAPGLTVEGGALATRTRSDIRGDAPGNLAGNVRNVSQIYSVYAGPTFHTGNGPASLSAAYRFGYVKAEAPDIVGIDPLLPPLDVYDSSTSHLAQIRAGVKAGTILPVGLSVAGVWQRENASQLDQVYDGKYARADAVLPVGAGLALVAGLGYEKIKITQRDPLRDGAGNIVRDGNGRFVTDPASPPRIAYQTDGLFWDAGVMYKPSARLMLEARVGRRYDSMSYTGSLQWQISRRSGLQVGVYDSVDSFGRQLVRDLASLPTSFNIPGDPFGDGFNGCVFGDTATAAGGCLTNSLGSIATASYRARGVNAVLSMNAGPTTLGLGLGYANRRYLVPPGVIVAGTSDDNWYGQFFVTQALDSVSSLSGNVYANYYESNLPGSPGVFGAGANGSYYRSFGSLSAMATLGISTFDVEGAGSTSAQALLGLRYGF